MVNGNWVQVDSVLYQAGSTFISRRLANCAGSTGIYDLSFNTAGLYSRNWRFRRDGARPVNGACPTVNYIAVTTEASPTNYVCYGSEYLKRTSDWEMCGTKVIRSGVDMNACINLCTNEQLFTCNGIGYENGRCHLFASGADCGSNADWMDWTSRTWHMVCELRTYDKFCGKYVERAGTTTDTCLNLCAAETFFKCRGFSWIPEVSKCILHEYTYNCTEAFRVDVTGFYNNSRVLLGSQNFTWVQNQTTKYTIPTSTLDGSSVEVMLTEVPYSVDFAEITFGGGFISFSTTVTRTPSVSPTPTISVTPTVSPSPYPTRVLSVLQNATSLIAVQWTGFSLNAGSTYYTAVDPIDGATWGFNTRQWVTSERQMLQPNALMIGNGATVEIHGFQFVTVGRNGLSSVGFQSIASDDDSIRYGFNFDNLNQFSLTVEGTLIATTWGGFLTSDRFELRFLTNTFTLVFVRNGYVLYSVDVSPNVFPLVAKIGASADARVRQVLWLNNIDAPATRDIAVGDDVEWTGFNYAQLAFNPVQRVLLRIDGAASNADAWGPKPISRASPIKGISFRAQRIGGWIGFTTLDPSMSALLDYGVFLSTSGALLLSEAGTMDQFYIGTFNPGDLVEIYFTPNKVFEVAREGTVVYTGVRQYDSATSEWPMMLRVRLTASPAEIFEAHYIGTNFTAPPIFPPVTGDRVFFKGYDPALYVTGGPANVNALNKLNSDSWSYASSRDFVYPDRTYQGVSFRIGATGKYVASLTKTSVCSGSTSSIQTFGLSFDANWRITLYLSGLLQTSYLFGYKLDDKISMFITPDFKFSVLINDIPMYTTPYAVFGTADFPLMFNVALFNSYSSIYNILWIDSTGQATPWPSPSITPTVSLTTTATPTTSTSPSASASPTYTTSPSVTPTPTLTPGMTLDTCLAYKIANRSSGVYTLSSGISVYCEMSLYGGGWELAVVISQNMYGSNVAFRRFFDTSWGTTSVKYSGWLGVPWNQTVPLTPFTIGGNNLQSRFSGGQTQLMYEFVNGYGVSYAGWCDTASTGWTFTYNNNNRYTCQKSAPYGSGHLLCSYGDVATCSGIGNSNSYVNDISLSSLSNGFNYAYQALPNAFLNTGATSENIIRAFDTSFDNDNSVGLDALVRVYVRKPTATPVPSITPSPSPTPSTTLTPSPSLVLSASPLPSVPTPTNPLDIRLLCSNSECGPVMWTGFTSDNMISRPYFLEKLYTSSVDTCDTNVMSTFSILSSTDKLRGYYFGVRTNTLNMYAGMAATNKNAGGTGFNNVNLGIYLDANSRITVFDAGVQGALIGSYYADDKFVLFIDPVTLRGMVIRNNRLLYTTRTTVDFTSSLTPVITFCSRGLAVYNATWIDDTFTWTTPTPPVASDPMQWTGFHDAHIDVDPATGRVKKISNNIAWQSGTQPSSIYTFVYSDVTSGRITGVEFAPAYSTSTQQCSRIGFDLVSNDDGLNSDIQYAFDFCTDSSIVIIDNGASAGCYGAYLPHDVFQLRVVNNRFEFVRNNQVVYTSVVVFTESTFGRMTFKAMMYYSKAMFDYFQWISAPYTSDPLPAASDYITWGGIYPFPNSVFIDKRNGTLSKEYLTDNLDTFAVSKHAINSFQDAVLGFTFQPLYSKYTLNIGFASLQSTYCYNNVANNLKYAIQLFPGAAPSKGEVRVYPSTSFSLGYLPEDWFQLRLRNDVDKTYVEFAVNGFVFSSTEVSVADLPLQPVVAFQTRFGILSQLAWISPDQYVTVDATAANKTVVWKYDPTTALIAGDGSLQALSTTNVVATSDRTFSQISFVRGVSFRVPKNNVALSIGFSLFPYSSYTIRFGLNLDTNSRITAIDNKFNSNIVGTFNPNDQFDLRLNEDNRFEVVRNGFILYTSIIALNDASEFPMVLILSMTGAGAKISEAKWIGSTQFATEASIGALDPILWAGRFDQYTIVTDSDAQSIEKLTGASWDALAVSQGRIETRDASVRGISFRPAYSNEYLRVGLARSADDNGLSGNNDNFVSNIKWALDLTPTGNVAIYDRAAYKRIVGSFTVNDEFQIRLNTDNKFEFMRAGTILYTSFDAVYITDFPLVLNVALYSAGAKLTSVHWISAQQFLAELTFKSLDPMTWTGVNTAILVVDPTTGSIQKIGSSSSFDNSIMSSGRIRSLSVLSVKGVRFVPRQNIKNFKIGFGLAGVMYFGVQLDSSGRVRVKDFLDGDAGNYTTYVGTYLPNDVFVVAINDNNYAQVVRGGVLLFVSSKQVQTTDLPLEITTTF
jgi:hypothetical protein